MLKALHTGLLLGLVVLLLAACGETSPAPTPASLPATAVTPTPMAAPTPTPEPQVGRPPAAAPTDTPTPTITPTFTPIPAPTPVPPSASFSVDLESGNAPLMVEFDNTSRGSATSHEWDFGDGTRSTDESPTHRYTIAGTYDVKLTVSGRGGEDTSIMTDLITVSPGEPVSLEIAPPNMTLAVQEGTQFTALARDEFGNVVPGDVKWAVSGQEGTITDTGLFTAETRAGTFEDLVMASLETDSGEITASANLIVKPGPLAAVGIEPTEVSLDIGATQSFAFAAFDDFDNEIEDAIVSWSMSPDFGEIDSDGLLTAGTTAGEFPAVVRLEVVKDEDRVSAAADLTIRPDPLDVIELQPSFTVVERGESQQFTASGFDEFGNEITGVEFTWSATGGEITSDGTFTAGDESGSYEVSVEATFKESPQKATATIPVPPVWIRLGELSQTTNSEQPVALLPDGKVLVVERHIAELYDPTTRTFSTVETECFREYHRVTGLLDGTVLVTGGYGNPRCAEIYDPETNTFRRVGDMKVGHAQHATALLRDGRVLVAGGNQGDFVEEETIDIAELYDPETESFRLTASLNTGRFETALTLLPDGRVFIASGSSSFLPDNCFGTSEIYDPVEGIFELTEEIHFAGCNFTTTLLNNGLVLITTGTFLAYLFDPVDESFRRTGNIQEHRVAHTAILLPSGEVLVLGGSANPCEDWPCPTNAVEIYDPRTETFTVTDAMNDAKLLPAGIVLANGHVLVVGGSHGPAGWLRSVELYIPSALKSD